MFKAPPQEKEWISWLYVVLWSLFLYTAIPFARAIQKTVASLFGGREPFVAFVLAVVVVAALGVAGYVVRLYGWRAWRHLLWLAGVGVAYGWCAAKWTSSPVEALHFLEYGFLGLLLYRALVHRVRDVTVHLSAVLLGAVIGVLDESIQWLTPARVFDLRDAGFNVLSVALMQVALAGGIRPAITKGKITAKSVRLACRFWVALLILVGLCLSNTPARVAWYSEFLPGLGFLKGYENVMTEYGYRHMDPEIGTFFSRFTLSELECQDNARGKDVAELLEPWRPHGKYPEFLKICRPEVDPFAHEFRVHAFCRDHHMGMLSSKQADRMNEAEKREHATTAYREYRIMQKYFSNTLMNSHYKLGPERVAWLMERLDESMGYVSPVSRSLIVRFSELSLRLLILALIVAGVAVDLLIGSRDRIRSCSSRQAV